MRRGIWPLAALVLLGAAPAAAGDDAERVARAVDRGVVYVHPRAQPRISARDQGRIRLRIVDRAFGRIKIAIVPERMAAEAGGLPAFGHRVDSHLELRGALLVRSGGAHYIVTSHPKSNETVAVVTRAINRSNRPTAQLLAAVDAIAEVDPGRSADLAERRQPGGVRIPGPPTAGFDDPTDDIVGGFKLALLIVAAAIALPFVVGTAWILLRIRRRRADEADQVDDERGVAEEELVTLGGEIQDLDLDTAMPDADRAALADYELAIASYDRASSALPRAKTLRRVRSATAAIDEGRQRVAAAKRRLEAVAAEAGGASTAEPER
jgi:hypothetical protein